MNSLGWMLLLLLLGLMAFAVLRLRAGAKMGEGPWPLYAKKPLSVPEQVLYFRLVKALPEHIVLAQVGLSRILGVKRSENFHAWNNRINRMSVDFVVCAKDAKVLAVIELDDASHQAPERQRADAKKNMAVESAGVRLIRWQAKSLPDEATIRTELYAQSGSAANSQPTPTGGEHTAALHLDTRQSI